MLYTRPDDEILKNRSGFLQRKTLRLNPLTREDVSLYKESISNVEWLTFDELLIRFPLYEHYQSVKLNRNK